jgi:hypothetical protein
VHTFKKPTDVAEFVLEWTAIVFFISVSSLGWAFFGETGEFFQVPAIIVATSGYGLLAMWYVFPIAGIIMLLSLAFLIIDLLIEKFIETQERQIVRSAIDDDGNS